VPSGAKVEKQEILDAHVILSTISYLVQAAHVILSRISCFSTLAPLGTANTL
jgi:hypothetical protein